MSQVREDAVAKAERLGLLLVKPGPTELFIDLDSEKEKVEFERRLELMAKVWPLATHRYTRSCSGNWHAYVNVPELKSLGDHERIALQAALGSDPLREILAIEHGRHGYEHTSVFFEVPEIIK